MDPITGMRDLFGVELRRRRYLVQSLTGVAESFGYEPVSVSLVERAEAYSEEIVGMSPWPEWNRKGCFFFDVEDYERAYTEAPGITRAVLVPEGTLSITRWLGAQLGSAGADSRLPLKIYYEQSCFRNELTGSLTGTKGRQFAQFGVEILGGRGPVADVEPLVLAHEMIRQVAGDNLEIVFRISSNKLFLALAERCGLTLRARVQLKEWLDTLAECRAGKGLERAQATREATMDFLGERVTAEQLCQWEYIVDRPAGSVTMTDLEMFAEIAPDEISAVRDVTEALARRGLTCEVDFCVVRSHEYYTGLTFEIDLIGPAGRAVEVGGGGRYDRLMGHFVAPGGPAQVPCTGFAFGLERLQAALDGILDSAGQRTLACAFDLSVTGEVRRVRGPSAGSVTQAVTEYLDNVVALREDRRTQRVSADVTRT